MKNVTLLGGIAMSLSLLSVSGAAMAAKGGNGGDYSNIVATAECVVDADGMLDVLVGYELSNDTLPIISAETLSLEKNVYYDTAKNKNKSEWFEVLNINLPLAASSATANFEDVNLCALSDQTADANSLRAVVLLHVDNANSNGATGSDFLARCVSFKPPVCN